MRVLTLSRGNVASVDSTLDALAEISVRYCLINLLCSWVTCCWTSACSFSVKLGGDDGPSSSPLLRLLLLPCVGMVGDGSLGPFWGKGNSSAGMLCGNGRRAGAATSRQWSGPKSWKGSRYGQQQEGVPEGTPLGGVDCRQSLGDRARFRSRGRSRFASDDGVDWRVTIPGVMMGRRMWCRGERGQSSYRDATVRSILTCRHPRQNCNPAIALSPVAVKLVIRPLFLVLPTLGDDHSMHPPHGMSASNPVQGAEAFDILIVIITSNSLFICRRRKIEEKKIIVILI